MTERRLASVMFTDIKGYTERMNKDEALGLELLQRHNEVMDRITKANGGTVVKSIGDAYLVEFPSAVAAVETGLAAQEAFASYNRGVDEDKRLLVRISIHLGEVTFTEGDVFGDAVNLASRLQHATPPGRVCLTRAVVDQVRGKLPCEFVPLGRHHFKGIGEPVEVIQVLRPGSTMPALSVEGYALKLRKCGACGALNPVGSSLCRLCATLILGETRDAEAAPENGLEAVLQDPVLWSVTAAGFGVFWFAGPPLLAALRPLELLNFALRAGAETVLVMLGLESMASWGPLLAQLAFPAAMTVENAANDRPKLGTFALFWLGTSLMSLGASALGRQVSWQTLYCAPGDIPLGPGMATAGYALGCALAALACVLFALELRKKS